MRPTSELTSIAPVDLSGVCVVIPAYNEERLIARCVQSVITAGLAPQQIFVINDCSSDRTVDVLAPFERINVIDNPERLGKVRGLQRAFERCQLAQRFEFIALLDADSYIVPHYFDAVVRAFTADQETVLVCGSVRSEGGNWIGAYRAVEYTVGQWIYKEGQNAAGVIQVAPGCASTYRSRIIRHLDWAGGTLVEDMDLTIQIHRRRLGRVHYVKDAISVTQDPRCLRDYSGQITRWYSGTWQVMLLRRLARSRQLIDLEFALLAGEGLLYALLLLMLPVLAFVTPEAMLRWVVFDQLLAFCTAGVCAVRLRRREVLLWAPTYFILRMVNCYVLLRTFWVEVIRRRGLETWFTVERYEGSDEPRKARLKEVLSA